MPNTAAACRAGHIAPWHLVEEAHATVPRPIVTAETLLAIRSLARRHKFAALDSSFALYERATKLDARNDLAWANASWAFTVIDPTLQSALDAWVKATGSSAARIARATYRTTRAGKARGDKWASNTSDSAFARMSRLDYLAWLDLQPVLEKDSRNLLALLSILDIAMANGDELRARDAAQRALAASPISWVAWTQVQYALDPRYFGSVETMAAVATAADSMATRNPQLHALGGFASAAHGDSLFEETDDTTATLKAYNQALRYGDSRVARFGRARLYRYVGRYQDAIDDLTCAAAYTPANAGVLALRGVTRLEWADDAPPVLARSLRAQGEIDLRLAEELDPKDDEVKWARKLRPRP
jgi:tetratricopeptide (TPR) repeat protein